MKEFELAETVLVEALTTQIDEVLAALGHPEALVTDESTISDFLERIPVEPPEYFERVILGKLRKVQRTYLNLSKIEEVSSKLGLVITPEERLVAVAVRLKMLGKA